ncbi:MAG TPA: nicotinate-nucleotide adenylyltransferase [Syntrophomonadaceae bacterium]|nr:nicotinate-nucleotide adenylyltransferase [Syntrophomonadaceae bacterium]
MRPKQRIGIMGGTFNPIHYGHLVAAEWSREALGLHKVFFTPSAQPPHKDATEIVAAEHRLQMVRLALKDHAQFEALDIEIRRSGPSYTVDTLEELSRRLTHSELYFIMGMDSFLDLPEWRNPARIAEISRLVVVTRPGYSFQLDAAYDAILPRPQEQLIQLEIPGLHISSSNIRHRIASAQTVRYLLPADVEAYIYHHQLYRK